MGLRNSGQRGNALKNGIVAVASVLLMAGCVQSAEDAPAEGTDDGADESDVGDVEGARGEGQSATATAYFAGGCFWGVEHLLQEVGGVTDVRSGYMGGHTEKPTYREVSSGRTGHAETVEVVYDPTRTTFEELARLFFEIHDPTQVDRQGPDRGSQYRSAIFYVDDEQRLTAERLIGILKEKGHDVATEVTAAGPFWKAEDYHQDYYAKSGGSPYCHTRRKLF